MLARGQVSLDGAGPASPAFLSFPPAFSRAGGDQKSKAQKVKQPKHTSAKSIASRVDDAEI